VGLLISLVIASCAKDDEAGHGAAALAVKYLDESGISGLTISVGIGQEIVWSEGFGFADMEQQVAIDPALTRFRVGSTAKSMTAMALGQLHDVGKLDLDAPIQSYLPDFPEKEATITTRMLAGHLGGIRHYQDDEFYSATPYSSVSDALEIFKDDPVEVRPGTAFSYSTYGYNLISAVVESAADQQFLAYMSERVFGPTGMTETVADHVVPIISNRSRYYRLQENQLVNTPWVDNSNKWAGGGFLSTSEDLVRFGRAHLRPGFLQASTLDELRGSQTLRNGEATNYGLGWRSAVQDDGDRTYAHSGGSVGGTTLLLLVPAHDLVVAGVVNISGPAPAMVRRVAQVFEDHLEKGR